MSTVASCKKGIVHFAPVDATDAFYPVKISFSNGSFFLRRKIFFRYIGFGQLSRLLSGLEILMKDKLYYLPMAFLFLSSSRFPHQKFKCLVEKKKI